jgi:hypothetical protein
MELVYYQDLTEDVLSNKTDVTSFLNSNFVKSAAFVSLEASEDGELIFITGTNAIYFFSFPERRIVMKLPYSQREYFDEDISLGQFYNRTVHVSRLF